MVLERRSKFKGLRRPGEIPQPQQIPFLPVLPGDVQFVGCDEEWRTIPAIGGFHLNQPIAPVRQKTPDVIPVPVTIFICHPANPLGKIGAAGFCKRCPFMRQSPFFAGAPKKTVLFIPLGRTQLQ